MSTERFFDKDGKPYSEKDIKMIRSQPASSSADASATANVAHDVYERESSPSPEEHVGAVAGIAQPEQSEVYVVPPDEGSCKNKARRVPRGKNKAELIFT